MEKKQIKKKNNSKNINNKKINKKDKKQPKWQIIINKIINNKLIDEYAPLVIMDLILYILLVFMVPLVYTSTDTIKWLILIIMITVLLEIIVTSFVKIKLNQIKFSVPVFIILFLLAIRTMRRKELYGVTSFGGLDPTPAWLDIIILAFIIVAIQYITLLVLYKLDNRAKKRIKVNIKK